MKKTALQSGFLGIVLGSFGLAAGALAAELPLHSGIWTADSYVGEKQQTVCEVNGVASENPDQILKLWHGYGQVNHFSLRGFAKNSTVTLQIGEYRESWETDQIGRINRAGVIAPTIITTMLELAGKPGNGALKVHATLAGKTSPTTLTFPLQGFPETYAAIGTACGVAAGK